MKKYLVGGAIRNELLKIPVMERDWVVVGSTPKEMLNNGFKQVGKEFPVFLHPDNHEEYALARTEKKFKKGHTGFICFFSPSVTLEEDLRRRDLTINAIARDEHGTIFDPYHGLEDIQNRFLRHISESFSEDPLRILRVARFAASFSHLGFKIAPETMRMMKGMILELPFLSPDRVWKETEKAISTKDPQVYFKVLKEIGALNKIFPEIDILFDSTKKSFEGNLGFHALKEINIASKITKDPTVRFASFFRYIGMNNFFEKRRNLKNKLDFESIRIIKKFCKRMRVPSSFLDTTILIMKYRSTISFIESLSPEKLVHFFNSIDVWRRPERLEKIITSEIIREKKEINRINYVLEKVKYIQKLFDIVKKINVKDIMKDGFRGIEIKKELDRRRMLVLSSWKENQLLEKKVRKIME